MLAAAVGLRTTLLRSDGAAVACGRTAALVEGLGCVLVAAGGCRKALLESDGTAVTCGRLTALVEDEVAW